MIRDERDLSNSILFHQGRAYPRHRHRRRPFQPPPRCPLAPKTRRTPQWVQTDSRMPSSSRFDAPGLLLLLLLAWRRVQVLGLPRSSPPRRRRRRRRRLLYRPPESQRSASDPPGPLFRSPLLAVGPSVALVGATVASLRHRRPRGPTVRARGRRRRDASATTSRCSSAR